MWNDHLKTLPKHFTSGIKVNEDKYPSRDSNWELPE